MRDSLPTLIFLAGFGQWSVLVASALVPLRLDWKSAFAPLPRLHRQMVWVYGGYIVLAIIANGALAVFFAPTLTDGSPLSRALCGYLAIFWSIRVSLQPFLDAGPFLTTWWLRLGYHTLTLLFLSFVAIFAWAAIG